MLASFEVGELEVTARRYTFYMPNSVGRTESIIIYDDRKLMSSSMIIDNLRTDDLG